MDNNKVDMINGPLLKKIIVFALPLAMGSIFQQLFNIVDTAVVGQFASSEALGAVGANAPVINLFINLFVGISVGSSVLIATYIGSGNKKGLSRGVHTSISISLICGLGLMILVLLTADPLLKFMGIVGILLTFLVFNILLAGAEGRDSQLNWRFSSLSFHVVLPIMYVAHSILFYERKLNGHIHYYLSYSH